MKIFTFWLLSLAAFCSCSKEPEMTEGGIIVISGTISDMDTKQPLEGVKILFTAYDSDEDFTLPTVPETDAPADLIYVSDVSDVVKKARASVVGIEAEVYSGYVTSASSGSGFSNPS